MDLQIGEAAGRIRIFLGQNPNSTLEETYSSLSVEPSIFYMALGWLAREDKLSIEGVGWWRNLSLKPGVGPADC
ncbi:MAG: winged helix-turn-helix domain-containing protein [Acidobacteria bacterium]|nr:winged helix-turn-helix domain-containing protein [Acidobacteriota bacterium]